MNNLKAGDWGDDVKSLQEILASLGYKLKINSSFDTATTNAVKSFQNTHLDENGVPLMVDGIVGPKTWWALTHAETTKQPSQTNNKMLFLFLGLGILALFLVGDAK